MRARLLATAVLELCALGFVAGCGPGGPRPQGSNGAVPFSTSEGIVAPDYSGVPLSVTPNGGGTNVNVVDQGTSVSLPDFYVAGSHPHQVLYIALTSVGTPLSDVDCRLRRDLKFPMIYSWNDNNDTIYVFYRGHGSQDVHAGYQDIKCSWSNSATVSIAAAAFYNVDTNKAEFFPSVTTASGADSAPNVATSSQPGNASFAVMMRDSRRSDVLFDASGPSAPASELWADNTAAGHNSVGSIVYGGGNHAWPLTGSAGWAAMAIDVPVAPFNFITYRLTGDGNPPRVSLESFVVGSGPNEALFVGITSPGPLDPTVTWGGQTMQLLDDYPAPNVYCGAQGHLYWYYLVGPQPGNHSLNVTWSNDTTGWGCPLVDVGAISFSGVNQANPVASLTHASGWDGPGPDYVDSITIPTAMGHETLALWGSGQMDACNWNQTPIVPGDGHGINFEASRADGVSSSNTHSIVHGASACGIDPMTVTAPWGMSGFDIVAAGGTQCGNGVCDSGENCSSCQADCGSCQTGICAATYGGISGVGQVCLDSAGSCELAYNSTIQSCTQICSQGGGSCQAVFNNLGACGHAEPLDCGTNIYQSAVCICSGGSPCGDGSCNAGESCSSCPADCGTCQTGICATTYGGISGVGQICLESADSCEVAYNSTIQSCSQICSQGGGTCQAVYNNLGTCGHAEPLECSTNIYQSAVCICSR